jgi:hypothetical protein
MSILLCFLFIVLLINPAFCLDSYCSSRSNNDKNETVNVPVLNIKRIDNNKISDLSIAPDCKKVVVSLKNHIYQVDLKTTNILKLRLNGHNIQKINYSHTGKYLGVIEASNELTGYYDFANTIFYTPLKGKAYYKLNTFFSFSNNDSLFAIAYTKRNSNTKNSICSEDADYYISLFNLENGKEIQCFKCPSLWSYSQIGLSDIKDKTFLYLTTKNDLVQIDINSGKVLNKQKYTKEHVFLRYQPNFINNCKSIFCLWKYNIPNTQKIKTIFCLSDIANLNKITKITNEKFRVKSFKISTNGRYICLYGCNLNLNQTKKSKYYFLVLNSSNFTENRIKTVDPNSDNPYVPYDIASSGKFIIYAKRGMLYKIKSE